MVCTGKRGKKSRRRTFGTDREALLAIDPVETDETPEEVGEKAVFQRNVLDEGRLTIESDHDLVHALLTRNRG